MTNTVKKQQERVWIELERPKDAAEGNRRAELATNMLRRLGVTHSRFWWSVHEGFYCYGDQMGYTVLSDNGQWLNLEFLGRAAEGTPETSLPVANAIVQKMQECGWAEAEVEGRTVVRHPLGM